MIPPTVYPSQYAWGSGGNRGTVSVRHCYKTKENSYFPVVLCLVQGHVKLAGGVKSAGGLHQRTY